MFLDRKLIRSAPVARLAFVDQLPPRRPEISIRRQRQVRNFIFFEDRRVAFVRMFESENPSSHSDDANGSAARVLLKTWCVVLMFFFFFSLVFFRSVRVFRGTPIWSDIDRERNEIWAFGQFETTFFLCYFFFFFESFLVW